MIRRTSFFNKRKQCGAALLIVSSVVLIGVTTVMIYTARVGIVEQKVTGNQIRAKQARQTAQSGLNVAMRGIRKIEVMANAGVQTSDYLQTKSAGGSSTNIHTIEDVGTFTVAYNVTSADSNELTVTVEGKSVDGTGKRTVTQNYKFAPFVSMAPPATTNVSGDITVQDPTIEFDNKHAASEATIWCGGMLKSKGSDDLQPAATLVRTQSQFLGTGQAFRRVQAQSNTVAGATPLPTGDALFQTFFTNKKKNIKAMANLITCPSGGCTSADLDGTTGLVWVVGNVNLDAPAIVGTHVAGGVGDPVLLVVEGNLRVNNAGVEINGMVFIDNAANGGWDNTGATGGLMRGAIIVDGNMSASGTLRMKYNRLIIDKLIETTGAYVPIPGTWQEA